MSTPSKIEAIFFAALEKTAAERAGYLDRACGADAELRRRVERLLEAHPQAAEFMARPAVKRLEVASRDAEPDPSSVPPEPYRPINGHSPAPRAGRPADIPGQDNPPGPAPANSSDATTDFARVDEAGSSGSVITDRIVANASQGSGDRGEIDPDRTASIGDSDSGRTVSQGAIDAEQTIGTSGPPGRSPAVRASQSESEGPRIPGYEILGTLGRGGMGVVYKARQTGLNRLVALKMIIGGNLAGMSKLARFRIEAEAVAQLRHPNIVQIYDVGEVDEMPYLSLELLEGGDLDDRLAGTPQPGVPAAELVATLARAIHAAHQARIVHRDLKPANVLLTADGVPKITDFGLAKRLESDDNQTRTGDIMGTPSYMAPEQAMGRTKDIGPAADVYALGAILYEVLTGRPPLKGETAMETVRLVIHNDPVPPSRLVPRLARDLETICLKCLNKAPEKRYHSAEELADDLDRFREGEPIKARPTMVFERGYKWAKRRPVAAMSLAFGLLVFLTLTGGGFYYEQARNSWVLLQQNLAIELLDRDVTSRTPDELRRDRDELASFRSEVKNEPRLQRISLRIAAKQHSVEDRLGEISSREASRRRDREDRERFATFQKLRQQAQLNATGFGVLDPTDRLERLRASAHAALATYARDPQAGDDAWTLADPLPAALQDSEKATLIDDCYDLLLIRSQAGEPAQGLRILDRALRLRPKTTAAYHRRRADCLERAGDLAGRDREIREAGLLDPLTPLDYFLNGRELFLRRRFADAVRPLNSALQADPDQISAHLLLAVCYLNMQPKRLGQARTSLDACIGKYGDLVGLYLMRALVSGQEGNEALETLARSHPDEEESARLRQDAKDSISAAEADYRDALKLKPDDNLRYVLLTNRGLMWLQSDRLDDAVVDLEAAIGLKPGLYQAHATLAQVYQRQGRPDDAAASFTRGIDCHPEPIVLAGLYRNRALLWAYRSDITPARRKSALGDLEEAIRLGPDMAMKVRDHVDRAKLLFADGQAREALAACDSALAIIPDDAEAHRARISSLMDLKHYDEVLISTDAYIARGKASAVIFEIRGLAREARRDYAAASADFNKALDLTPEGATDRRTRLLNLRGWAYHFASAPKLALADFEQSLRLDPNQNDALAGRGLARILLGNWRPAVSDAEAAVKLVMASAPRTEEERKARSQALFNAARVYAMAVEFAAQDVSRQGERAVALYRAYRSRALNLLDEALKYAPDREYRDAILNEPALRSLRHGRSRSPGLRFGSFGIDPGLKPSMS